MPYINALMFDIKCIDPVKHKDFTGVSSKLILENFRKICTCFPEMSKIVRTPVIPGFNDSPEDIRKIADFIRPFPRVIFELLPYHRFGEPKYRFLDKSYLLPDRVPPDANRMRLLREVAGNR